MQRFLLLTLFIYSFTTHASVEEVIKGLNSKEREKLDKGDMIFKAIEVKGTSWPEIQIWSMINTTPLQSVAIFANYELQKEYVPNLLKAKVVKQASALEADVEYELHMSWPLSNVNYTHAHNLKKMAENEFQVKWHMIKSDSTKEARGRAEFYPYKGKTLIYYVSYVKPQSFFAQFFTSHMIRDVQRSIKDTIKYTEESPTKHKENLKKSIGFIERSFKGEKVY